MGLSNAERQRRWRDKQREQNREQYLKKERDRKRGKYIATDDLTDEQREKRRQKCRVDAKKHYEKTKKSNRKKRTNRSHEKSGTLHDMQKLPIDKPISPLKVKMSFKQNKKATGVKKRYARALRKAYRDIENLKDKVASVVKQKRTLQKTLQRQRKSHEGSIEGETSVREESPSKSKQESPMTSTPRTKTKFMLRKAGLNLNKNSVAYKRLVLGNALVDHLNNHKGKKTTRDINQPITAVLAKKYRCINQVSKEIGMTRKKVCGLIAPRATKSIRQEFGEQVKVFLEREDNSTVLPGKRDTVKKDKEVCQKRILNDYLHNLFQKFQLENPHTRLSRSSFCALRPANILLTRFASRKTCLCMFHQNFALKVKCMQREGLQCSKNPDVFIREFNTNDLLRERLDAVCTNAEVKFRIWKKVQDGEKLRWKEVEETLPKDEFVKKVVGEREKFEAHVVRVKNQYAEMRKLRETLPKNDVLIWMEFAENYNCTAVEEVQSAYWNQQMVSLHTMVVYFPDDHEKKVQSFVGVSSSLSHNAAAVYAILKKLVPLVKEEFPNLEQIHYLTDSPSSQYRNKSIFKVVCDHENEFGVKARWNYLETGHGKGPCDGLGASVKRAADMAVRREKVSIQDGNDFFEWTKSADSSTKVKYIWYSEDDVADAMNEMKSKEPLAVVTGTMKLHAVVPCSRDTLVVRDLSCYCEACLANSETSDCTWKLRSLNHTEKAKKKSQTSLVDASIDVEINEPTMSNAVEQNSSTQVSESEKLDVKVDDWVAAAYEEKWYIGQVIECEDDEEVEINFLEKSGKYGDTYKFPLVKDELMIQRSDILMVLEFQASGKSKRSYKLAEKEKEAIIQKFNEWLRKNN